MLKEFTASIQKQNFVPEQSGDVYDPDTRLKKEAMKKRVEARIASKKGDTPTSPELKTVGWIDELADNEIFVFGSNKKGIHGKGAALDAKNKFGAVQGVGEGLTGQSYALPTKSTPYKSLTIDEVSKNLDTFLQFAADNPDKTFKMSAIGTNLAEFKPQEIANILFSKDIPSNVQVPESLFKLKGGGSLGAAKLNDPNVFDEVIEEYTPGSKFLDDFVKNIPGYIIVPFEQMIESGLRASGYKKAANLARALVKWELYTFATSLGANVIGRGEGALTSPRLAQAHLLLGNHEEFKKRAENIEEDMMENSAAVGQPLMSAIIKAMPSYWLDEWLLKRNPEFEGWKEMFPQVGTLKKGAEIGLRKLFGNE